MAGAWKTKCGISSAPPYKNVVRAVQKLGTRIARRFRRSGLASDLPEVRGVAASAAEFDS